MLLSRQPHNVTDKTNFQNTAVRLSFSNEKVAKDNYERLEQLQETVVQINAHHSNPRAKSLSSEEMGGLEPIIYLSKKARVKLNRNLWTEAGLCNGTMGTIKDIIFSESHKATMLPVRFFLILVSLFFVEVSVTRPVFHIWYCTRGFLFRLKIVLPPS